MRERKVNSIKQKQVEFKGRGHEQINAVRERAARRRLDRGESRKRICEQNRGAQSIHSSPNSGVGIRHGDVGRRRGIHGEFEGGRFQLSNVGNQLRFTVRRKWPI